MVELILDWAPCCVERPETAAAQTGLPGAGSGQLRYDISARHCRQTAWQGPTDLLNSLETVSKGHAAPEAS